MRVRFITNWLKITLQAKLATTHHHAPRCTWCKWCSKRQAAPPFAPSGGTPFRGTPCGAWCTELWWWCGALRARPVWCTTTHRGARGAVVRGVVVRGAPNLFGNFLQVAT